MCLETKPLVSIFCLVYNHEDYIRECLDGILSQECAFRYEVVVHDDASTDSSASIIKEYQAKFPEVIRPIFQSENHYKKIGFNGIIKLMNSHCSGRYAAFCEGDDYWIDPRKLQKQVDFLESHPDYSMCCSDARIKSPDGELDWCRYRRNCDAPLNDIINGGGYFIPTPSLMFRRLILSCNIPECHVADYPLQIFCALKGKVYWFCEKQVVYRYKSESSWSKNIRSLSVKVKLPGWISEIEMLKAMDRLSGGVYSKLFKKRIADFIASVICVEYDSYDILYDALKDYMPCFTFRHRFKLYFFSRHHQLYRLFMKAYYTIQKL